MGVVGEVGRDYMGSLGDQVTSRSRTVSNVHQLAAMLGATLRRLGVIPLYRPLKPSCLTMVLMAPPMELYWYPMPDMVLT